MEARPLVALLPLARRGGSTLLPLGREVRGREGANLRRAPLFNPKRPVGPYVLLWRVVLPQLPRRPSPNQLIQSG